MNKLFMQRIFHTAIILLITTGLFFIGSIFSFSYGRPIKQSHTEIELIPERNAVTPAEALWVGLRMNLDPGWHVYWQNPGDSGYATSIKWDLPNGFKAGPIQWPYPERIDIDHLTSYAYEGEVYLLSTIDIPKKAKEGETYNIKAEVNWLACKLECIPGTAQLDFDINIFNAVHKPVNNIFNKARMKLPLKKGGWSYTPPDWEIKGFEDREHIYFRIIPKQKQQASASFEFFPLQSQQIDHAAAQSLERKDGYDQLKLKKSVTRKMDQYRSIKGVLVADKGLSKHYKNFAYELDIPLAWNEASPGVSSSNVLNLLAAIAFAFIGGLILNLMPCVLPVLSIKVLGLIKHSRESQALRFKNAMLFSLGILAMFWALALMMLFLKWGGLQVGWGFQFQSPVFLILLSFLFFWLGLNLLGLFEFRLPASAQSFGSQEESLFQRPFLSGLLATIVATPCTAPFMGSALGYALVKPPIYSFVIFTFLGLGMACPYFILSQFPFLLKFVPKPGPWMQTLKRFFSLLFFATTVWLGWILYLQKGLYITGSLVAGLILLGMAAWFTGQKAVSGQQKKIQLGIVSLILAAMIVSLGSLKVFTAIGREEVSVKEDGIAWQAYTPELLFKLRMKNKPIFIDFTAAWCITCQVNERVVFQNKDVVEIFKALQVEAVKADLTNYDEKVTKALSDFGKNSIPLYVLYTQDPKQEPILFPEIITPSLVIKVFEENLVEQSQ